MFLKSRHRQKGAVIVLTALALFALLGMVGLAIDSGHLYINKTRLQNAVDAAALSAATNLLEEIEASTAPPGSTISTSSSVTQGTNTFNQNIANSGNTGLNINPSISLCFTNSLTDFSSCLSNITTPVSTNTPISYFVRAQVSNVSLTKFIIQVLGITNKSVGATAVAGTIGLAVNDGGSVCKQAPFFICDSSSPYDPDCSNGTCFGKNTNTTAPPTNLYIIKTGSQTCSTDCAVNLTYPNGTGTASTSITPTDFNSGVTVSGNNYLLNLVDSLGNNSTGTNDVRNNILFPQDCTDGSMDTKAGTSTAILQAFNALFGNPSGSVATISNVADFADPVTADDISFSEYKSRYTDPLHDNYNASNASNIGAKRRLWNVPVATCPATINGSEPLPIKSSACVFLTRQIDHGGGPPSEGYKEAIVAELVDDPIFCPSAAGHQNVSNPAVPGSRVKIVLYKYVSNNDS